MTGNLRQICLPIFMMGLITGVCLTFSPPLVSLETVTQPQDQLPLPLQGKHKVILLGDSITEAGGKFGGYIWLMQRYLNLLYPQQSIELINEGVSGNQSADLKARFKEDVITQLPDLVILNIGVNDALSSLKSGKNKAKKLEGYRQNLTAMVQAAKAKNLPVLLLSPTLVSEDLNSPESLQLVQYVRVMSEVAQQNACQYIDLNLPFQQVITTYQRYGGKTHNILTRDGVHPNLAGYQIMAYTILLGLGVPQENLQNLQVAELSAL